MSQPQTVYEYIATTTPDQRCLDAAAGVFPFVGASSNVSQSSTWFFDNNGLPCGCIEPEPGVPLLHRRFSGCGIIDVSPSAPQAYFRIAPSVKHNGSFLTLSCTNVYLELRRKGLENLIATYQAWRVDGNGYVGFYFDDVLWHGAPGFYIGDIFLNCQYCLSVQLRLPPCEAVVTDCYALPALETCCEAVCCGVIDAAGLTIIGGGDCNAIPTGPPFFENTNPGPVVSPDCIDVCYPPGTSCIAVGTGTAGS